MKFLLVSLAWLGLAASAAAQDSGRSAGKPSSKPLPPDGPLLRMAPEFSQWIVSFQYTDDPKKGQGAPTPGGASPSDARPRQVVTTKTNQMVREQITDLAGRASENWFSGNQQYTRLFGETAWIVPGGQTSGTDLISNPLPRSGFRGMEYVKAGNYAGTIPYNGGTCLVFVPDGASKMDSDDPAKLKKWLETQPTIAYIDADKRLPVVQRVFGEMRSYRFTDAPVGMQTLPADLVAQLKYADESRARLEARAPRP